MNAAASDIVGAPLSRFACVCVVLVGLGCEASILEFCRSERSSASRACSWSTRRWARGTSSMRRKSRQETERVGFDSSREGSMGG